MESINENWKQGETEPRSLSMYVQEVLFVSVPRCAASMMLSTYRISAQRQL